ncbi:MAG: fibronectin type III domain-containing protein [Parcubacteria group bacterium]|nr:fibronectin type III domain-containing protein [Parcubacteria group bacterium]
MKLFNKTKFIKFVTFFTLVGMFIAGPSYAAPDDLVVNFESTPLFNEANFLPGNIVTRTVEVTNNTDSSKDIIVESINVTDPDNFASALNLVISKGDDELYNDTLANFFDAGEVNLSSVTGSGGSTTYSFAVSFISGSGNDYQENELGFDIVVGFAGEGGNEDGENGGNGGGGGGNGGGGIDALTILNETVRALDIETTSVTIVWDTSYRSTSRVVYGTSPNLFDFNSAPNYGYPLSTAELDSPASTNGTFNHSVAITGLASGTTYYFRAISHASPDTLSFEKTFVTLGLNNQTVNAGETGEVIGTQNSSTGRTNPSGQSDVAGVADIIQNNSIDGETNGSGQTDNSTNNEKSATENLTANIGGVFKSVSWWWLIILFAVVVFLIIYLNRKKKLNS